MYDRKDWYGTGTIDLDLRGVFDFLVLLEVGHYGRAAARLHLSASALSKRIQRLEHHVGVTLVMRDASGTTGPTAAGARFAEHARPLLAAARAAREAALTVTSLHRHEQRPLLQTSVAAGRHNLATSMTASRPSW